MADGMEKLPSYDAVMENLFLGDKRTARDMEVLKSLGVTHIVNATLEVRNYFEKEPNFHYYNAACMDTDASDIGQYFVGAVDFIDAARKEGHGVLVHCQQGVSRSASVVVAYILATQDRSLMDAYSFVRKKRDVCKIRPNFLKQLVHWEQGLQKKKDDKAARKGEKRKEGVAASENGTAGPNQVEGPATVRGPLGPPNKAVQGAAGPPLPPAPATEASAKSDFFNRKRKKVFGSSMPGM
jgi:protein-tyrosine phosphatase